jgi:putative exosortase-associated protein (TIGR04073 family)
MGIVMKRIFKSLLVLSALFFFSPQAAMAEGYGDKPSEKLTTGVSNILTGFLEWPKTVKINYQSQGPLYGMTAGLLKGFWFSVARTGFGIIDTATFVFPGRVNKFTPVLIWEDFDKETVFEGPPPQK